MEIGRVLVVKCTPTQEVGFQGTNFCLLVYSVGSYQEHSLNSRTDLTD